MSPHSDSTVKGLEAPTEQFDGSGLRVLIVHARWNEPVITPLLKGTIDTLLAGGVKRENIIIETVPGSYELPFACARLIAASKIQSSNAATDLMSTTSLLESLSPPSPVSAPSPSTSTSFKPLTIPYSAAIAIGTLIKGSTSHYEYISSAVTQGLMRVQLDSNVPVIYGVLNCLTEEQALQRAGVGRVEKGHCHGIDWGNAALELGVKGQN